MCFGVGCSLASFHEDGVCYWNSTVNHSEARCAGHGVPLESRFCPCQLEPNRSTSDTGRSQKHEAINHRKGIWRAELPLLWLRGGRSGGLATRSQRVHSPAVAAAVAARPRCWPPAAAAARRSPPAGWPPPASWRPAAAVASGLQCSYSSKIAGRAPCTHAGQRWAGAGGKRFHVSRMVVLCVTGLGGLLMGCSWLLDQRSRSLRCPATKGLSDIGASPPMQQPLL